jgi:hypothetical protein
MTGSKTEHYAAEQWADFVNGQLTEKQNRDMQDHLDTGCQACSKSSEVWRGISATARRESLYEAPEWAQRYVRNAFAVAARPRPAVRTKLRIPRLVLDSFWQPAPVGIRSAAVAPRHLLYKSEEISIELQIEPELESDKVSIAGQVSNMALGGEGLGEIPILLIGAQGEVVRAFTNKLGEFRLSVAPEKGLQFAVDMANGEQIAIPLSDTLF